MIVLLDFAQNYTFIIQDEIQSRHWVNDQATLHPFVFYFRKNKKLEAKSFCVLSDSKEHSASAVHAFQTKVIEEMKLLFPHIKHFHYFSDGAPQQYKNRKNLINLAHHFNDFGISASWNFFATAHEKSPCDGIGGTVKRLVRMASLRGVNGNPTILNVDEMFEYCKTHITGIQFIKVDASEVNATNRHLNRRYNSIKTIPGTQSHHCYEPLSTSVLRMKKISESEEFEDVSFLN